MLSNIKEQAYTMEGTYLSEFMKKRLRLIMNEYSDHMSTGACKSFEDYKQMAGVVEGLALAERELLDWVEKHIQEE